MSCGVGCRRGLDSELLWLWHRLRATALIQPLAWEPPYAASVALNRPPPPKKKPHIITFHVIPLSFTIIYSLSLAVCLREVSFSPSYPFLSLLSFQSPKPKT